MTNTRRLILQASAVISCGGALLARPESAEAALSCDTPRCTDSCAEGLGTINCAGCPAALPECEWDSGCWFGDERAPFIVYCGFIS